MHHTHQWRWLRHGDQLRPERPAVLSCGGRAEQLPQGSRVGAPLAAGVQPPHRQARAGAGCAAARANDAPRDAHRGRPRLRAQGPRAPRRSRRHAARHPRGRRHAHGRGDRRLRAVDRVLLPLARDPPLPRALPEGAGEGARCGRQRGAGRGGARRGGLRPQLHRRAGRRARVQASAWRSGSSPHAGAITRWRSCAA